MTEIIVLAVTRLSDGVCVAGVTNDGDWVRPTRPNAAHWRQLEYSDCRDASGEWIVRKGNTVRMDLIEPIPKGAHSEDWLVGQRHPELVEEVSKEDYRGICKELQEKSAALIEAPSAKRSLMMVHPKKITSFTFNVETNMKGQKRYTPRCFFWLGGKLRQRVPISDAEWRGYGRGLRKQHGGDCRVIGGDAFDQLDAEDCWLTLGRNEFDSTIYLMVIGVHLFPPRRFPRDFKR